MMYDSSIPILKQDEGMLDSVALWGGVVAVTTIVSSAIDLLAVFLGGAQMIVPQLVVAFVSVALASWLYQASAAFRKAEASTADGQRVADQRQLMEGFRKLQLYFKTTAVVVIVVASLIVLTILFSLAVKG